MRAVFVIPPLVASLLSPSLASQDVLRGRVRAPAGVSVGDVHILAIEETHATHGRLLAHAFARDSRPRLLSTRTTARGSFGFDVPPKTRWSIRAVTADRRHVSAIARFASSGRPASLQLAPACTIRFAHEGTWRLQAFDRKRREFFIAQRGIGRDNTTVTVAPGRYRLRLIREDRGRELEITLDPGATHVVRKADLHACTVRLELPAVSGTSRATLVLPWSLAHAVGRERDTNVREVVFEDGRAETTLAALGLSIPVVLRRPNAPDHGFILPPLRPGRTLDVRTDPATGRGLEIKTSTAGRVVALWDRFGLGKRVFDLRHGAQKISGLPKQKGLLLGFGEGKLGEQLRGCAAFYATGDRVEMPMTIGADLSLRVRAPGSGFAREARVRMWPVRLEGAGGQEDLYPTLETYTDRRGRARLDGLHHGKWKLRIDASPWKTLETTLTLASGASVEESFTLELGRSLVGKILSPDGKPVPNLLVELDDPLPDPRIGRRFAWTDARGVFTFAGLDDGVYRIEAARSRGTTRELARNRATPGDTGVVLRLKDEDPERR